MIRTLIVDDQFLIREGLKALLKPATEIELIGFAEDGAGALEKIASDQPDVVLLDINLPGVDGLQVAKQVSTQSPQVKIIMLSSFDSEEYVVKAMEAGAKGYLLKSVSEDELEWSIRLVYQGYSAFKSELINKLNLPDSSVAAQSSSSSSTKQIKSHAAVRREPQQRKVSQFSGKSQSQSKTAVAVAKSGSKPSSKAQANERELRLAQRQLKNKYRLYRQQRPKQHFHSFQVNRVIKTMASFEFRLLMFIILFSLGFLVFVALS